MEKPQIKFNLRLRELREEKGLKQIELAKIFGIRFTRLSSWETGDARPSYEYLVMLAQFFEVTVGYLLGIEEFS